MKGGQTILSPLGPEVNKEVFFQSLGATNNWITETRKDKEQWGSLDLKSVLIITAYLPLKRSDLLPCLLTILCFESAPGSSKGGPLKCNHPQQGMDWYGLTKNNWNPDPLTKTGLVVSFRWGYPMKSPSHVILPGSQFLPIVQNELGLVLGAPLARL